MRIRKVIIIAFILSVVFLTACSKEDKNTNKKENLEFVPNQVVLAFNVDTPAEKVEEVVKELDGEYSTDALSDINMYLVTLNNKKFKSLDEIHGYCSEITTKYNGVVTNCYANSMIYFEKD